MYYSLIVAKSIKMRSRFTMKTPTNGTGICNVKFLPFFFGALRKRATSSFPFFSNAKGCSVFQTRGNRLTFQKGEQNKKWAVIYSDIPLLFQRMKMVRAERDIWECVLSLSKLVLCVCFTGYKFYPKSCRTGDKLFAVGAKQNVGTFLISWRTNLSVGSYFEWPKAWFTIMIIFYSPLRICSNSTWNNPKSTMSHFRMTKEFQQILNSTLFIKFNCQICGWIFKKCYKCRMNLMSYSYHKWFETCDLSVFYRLTDRKQLISFWDER